MADYKPRYLVMVTASANNNKYYKQIPNGDSWTAEYGRIGSSPQRRTYSMSQWESKYREKIRKGYVDQSELAQEQIVYTLMKEVCYEMMKLSFTKKNNVQSIILLN